MFQNTTISRRQALDLLLKSAAATGAIVVGGLLIADWRKNQRGSTLFAGDLLNPKHPLPEHLLTPIDEFYVQSYALLPPTLKATDWQLQIDGAVTNPLTISWDEVLAAPQQDIYLTMECIGNQTGGNLIGNALWTGTPLLPWLQRAGVLPEATEWVMHGADSYETTLPIAELMRPDVRLVHRMNGEPLTRDHGYPMRIIIPGHYGQKQPKWIVRLEAIAKPKRGYWERQGWSNTAIIPTHSLVRQLQADRVWNRHHRVSFTKDGELGWGSGVLIAGVALDGTAPISRVMVSTDDGSTWQSAEQSHPDSPHEWTLWRYFWQPTQPGNYTVLARAETSNTQQSLEDDNPKDGSSGALRIFVTLS
ncbi:MAG: molybdopterin-dependent oxidoreductase [Cyanobacteria bacterium]|nr:molybdopterin-dependent oxidoreductase [Cyanobacteriota bacterium]MDW8203027.1 molybdopterin-dependent oxidoreductase [Cyanobacteriota bacterium SKYGB_h_bin112]